MAAPSTPSSARPMRVYHFGLFELQPEGRRLLRQGRETRIQDQPLELLVALVERPGAIVTREELKSRLWADGTFVDFDKSLGVAVAKLRDVLGDNADNPTFVETVPKRGYRFIAPVQTTGSSARTAPRAFAVEKESAKPQPSLAAKVVALAGLVILLFAVGGWVWWHRASAKIPERARVVVGDFANSTSNSVFDGALRRAAVIGLAQSPYLSVEPDDTLGRSLQNLGRPPDDKLTPALAREVCQSDHAAASIYGSIQESGSGYSLTLQADRCDTGSQLVRETELAATQQEVLPKLDAMLASLRSRLGESRESLQKYDVPVEQATTSSLEALKAYQLGLELRSHTKNLEARPAFKTAIALDANFAIAYAQLGSSYSNVGNTKEAIPYFQKAFDLRARATEPERLYITGRYFDIVTGEAEKAAQTYKLWTQLYPNEWRPYNSVANNAYLMGRFEIAVAAAKEAVRLAPNQNFGYSNLLASLVALDRVAEARALCQQMLAQGHDDGFIHLDLFGIAVLENDREALDREFDWSRRHPEDEDMVYGIGQLDLALGKIKEGTSLLLKVAATNGAAGETEAQASALAVAAEVNSEMGWNAVAQKLSADAVKLGQNETILGLCAIVAARGHDVRTAQALQQQLNDRYPIATFNIGVFSPMIRTMLAAPNLTAEKVKSMLEPAEPYEYGFVADMLPIYIRATSYLQAGEPAAAGREFQKILDHRSVDVVSTLYPLSLLGSARSLAMRGKTGESRKAYDQLLALWSNADKDLPVLIQAQKEYRQLK